MSQFLPTPKASDLPDAIHRRNSHGTYYLPGAVARLPKPVRLFKTPTTANLGSNGASQHPDKRKAGGHGPTLDDEVSHLLPDAVEEVQDWVDFEPAIRRQEHLSGVTAPIPTEIGPKGGRRLAVPFAEWLMWIPPGHVTDVSELNRKEQLARIGNGVVPIQAYTAYEHLLHLIKEKHMTDVATEAPAQEGWDAPEREAGVTYPEYGPLPEARISLNFTPGKAPQLTVRAHTATELTAALQELEEVGVYGAIGVAHASMGAQASIGAGLGPTTPVPAPQGPPAPPQQFQAAAQQQFNQQPAQQFPQQGGQAPAAWQNAGAPQQQGGRDNTPEYRQAGWYALTVPFKPQGGNPGKPGFDQTVQQYQMKKGRPSEGGQYSFNGANKTWYVTPEAVQVFGVFNPLPA